MAKLDRVHQKIFASTAPASDIGVIGSLHEGNPTEATSVQDIQSLAAFEAGIRSIVIGENSPIIEEDNALYKLITHQLAYILQNGIPEWDASTDYHVGQICIFEGKLYQSIANNNLGENPLTSTGKWISAVAPRSAGHVFVNSNYNITAEDNGKILLVDGSAGSVGIENDPYFDYWWNNIPYPPEYAPLDMELPGGFPGVDPNAPYEGDMLLFLPDEAPPAGFKVTIKDAGKAMSYYWSHAFPQPYPPTSFAENPVRIVPGRMRAKLTSMWTINQYGAIYEDVYDLHKLSRAGGTYELYFDGEKWWLSSAEETLTSSEKNFNGGPVFTHTEINQIFSTSSGLAYSDLTNSEVRFNKREGRPVEITLVPLTTNSFIEVMKGSTGFGIGNLKLVKNGVDAEDIRIMSESSTDPYHGVSVGPSTIRFIDTDSPPGQVIYKLQGKVNSADTIFSIVGCRVMVREL